MAAKQGQHSTINQVCAGATMDKNNKVKESRGESGGRERGSFSLRSSSVYVKIKIK